MGGGGQENPLPDTPACFSEVPHHRASGMIPRETGRGLLSISGAHRVAAVERLVGATLVVALPPNGATVRRPLLGHYRTGGVERRLSRETMRPRGHPQGVRLRSSGTGSFKADKSVQEIRDRSFPGSFGVRVRISGRKTFKSLYRTGGRRRRMKVGICRLFLWRMPDLRPSTC